jgi:hypothetical protein
MKLFAFLVLLLVVLSPLGAQSTSLGAFAIARLQYRGGGDWYNDPSAEANLLKFIRDETAIDVDPRYEFVEISSEKLFFHPFLFLTGHGNISFTDYEAERLRTYLERGGFLYADDDYGMDKAFRREMKKVLPGADFVELPFSHPIYSSHFRFPNGVPKTHEHDKNPPRGFGLFHRDRMVVFYTFESNPSDGWADPKVHRDPEPVRLEALRFGTNIVVWALSH